MSPLPIARSRAALRHSEPVPLPREGAGRPTPWRLASDMPIATACFRDLTLPLPCLSRCIASRTNLPAWVEGRIALREPPRARLAAERTGMD
jgi:hypothetical protein